MTPFNNRKNVAIVIPELTILIKSQKELILLVKTHLSFVGGGKNKQTNTQTDNSIKRTPSAILFCNFPIKLMSFSHSPLIASFQ